MTVMKKAVSNIIGFALGIIIILVTVIPLFMFLTSARSDLEKIIGNYEAYQDLKSLEKLSVEADYTSTTSEIYYLRNTGSIPIKLVRAVIQSALGLDPYYINIMIEPGQRIPLSQIFTQLGLPYDPASLRYVVSVRGKVFPIAEQIIRIPPPSSTPGSSGGAAALPAPGYGNPFTPSSSLFYWNFTDAVKNNRVDAYYNLAGSSCTYSGQAWVGLIANYNNKVLTINSTDTKTPTTVTYNLGNSQSGCAKFVFKNLLNASGSYIIVVYYRVVIASLSAKDRVSIDLNFTVVDSTGRGIGSSVTSFQWAPKTDLDYIVYSGYVAIPIYNPVSGFTVSGNVDLVFKIVLTQINAQGSYQVGVEYLAFQGVQVNPVSVS